MEDFEDLDLYNEEIEDELSIIDTGENILKFNEEKITSPVMTIYEKTRVISERIKQLDNGYKSTIEKEINERNLFKSYDIATLEFQMGKIPSYYIKRILPNNTYELWSHEDFKFYPH